MGISKENLRYTKLDIPATGLDSKEHGCIYLRIAEEQTATATAVGTSHLNVLTTIPSEGCEAQSRTLRHSLFKAACGKYLRIK